MILPCWQMASHKVWEYLEVKNMASELFLQLKAEHNRLQSISMGKDDPPKEEIRRLYNSLKRHKMQITDPGEKTQVDILMLCWETYVKTTGEMEALTDEEADRRRPRPRFF